MKKTSGQYISDLDFACFRTYSFQRTEAHRALKELYTLRSKGRLTKEQMNIYETLEQQTKDRYSEKITDVEGNLNRTAVMIREVSSSDEACNTLLNGLSTEIEEEILYLCAPIYRDAILFYNNNNELIEGINICFECDRIETIHGEHITTDFKTFKYLKQLLLQLDHPIEDPDSFKADYIMDTINKNKAKINKSPDKK